MKKTIASIQPNNKYSRRCVRFDLNIDDAVQHIFRLVFYCFLFVRDSKIILPGPRHQEDVLRGEAVVGKMARHPQGNQIPQETQPSKLHILLWVLPQRTHRLGKKTRIRGRANHVKQNLAHWFPPCFGCEYFLRLKHIHPRV